MIRWAKMTLIRVKVAEILPVFPGWIGRFCQWEAGRTDVRQPPSQSPAGRARSLQTPLARPGTGRIAFLR